MGNYRQQKTIPLNESKIMYWVAGLNEIEFDLVYEPKLRVIFKVLLQNVIKHGVSGQVHTD